MPCIDLCLHHLCYLLNSVPILLARQCKLNSIDRASDISGEEMNVTVFRIKWSNIVHVIY